MSEEEYYEELECEGYDAFHSGIDQCQCPYAADPERQAWMIGWHCAATERHAA